MTHAVLRKHPKAHRQMVLCLLRHLSLVILGGYISADSQTPPETTGGDGGGKKHRRIETGSLNSLTFLKAGGARCLNMSNDYKCFASVRARRDR